ncbi:Plasmid stabilization system [Candidatus Methylomirabilis lanthanidiphila]|uniref:Plasmid stabilization system n=1 Tax=Candidatus Methylomirabilis lanthanidiphila TaxID=2211376 RepID=A0A564ZGS7_9BACT|nr:type II toxin-antitoxin system RelE/ParE family toxin [Candidatus Methylomirabilis lanthanidiphila]VUZ84107.1 Plasmid stabilization system [Candidatus Methylomirabilis lanthanidiphila]
MRLPRVEERSEQPVHRLMLGPRAQRDLDRLRGKTWTRVKDALINLTHIPRPKGCRKLRTRAWRIRVGDIRGLYDIDGKARTVEVLRVKHRRESYRGL